MACMFKLGALCALGLSVVACGSGGGYGGGGGGGGGTPVAITGQVQYQRPSHNTLTNGIDYTAVSTLPVRGATVEARAGSTNSACASGNLLGSAVTNATGNYALTSQTTVAQKICVRAEVIKADAGAGQSSWNMQVRDNTSSDAIYILESAALTPTIAIVQNLTAGTGWGGTSYTSTRASAPFAILDSAYSAIQKILTADAATDFPAADIFWSVNNTNSDGNVNNGQIGTSYYAQDEIYILGDDNNDTDEFDGHVIIHEFGHYLEDNLSRSDSIGGSHGGGDLLDMRVAYGEGFGNAWSGIVTDDPRYQDSFGASQAQGFDINVETDTVTALQDGWFSETSVQAILYDLYDATNEGGGSGDAIALGVTPLWNVWVGAQRTTPALTSIHTFLDGLRDANPGSSAAINTLAAANDVQSTDEWGAGETNDGGTPLVLGNSAVLPVHVPYTVGSGVTTICTTDQWGTYNTLGNQRFLRFTVATNGARTFSAASPNADIDAYLYNAGTLISALNGETAGNESWSQSLAPGTYVLSVNACENVFPGACQGDGGSTTNNSPGPRCFTVTIN